MVAQAKKSYIAPEEYLERERAAETKSEYYDGVIVAMAGASRQHDRITVNMLRHLSNQLDGTSCEPFSDDIRVSVPVCNRYYYPDASVVCGEAIFADSSVDTLTNPTLIVEVLSPSTAMNDRGDKFLCYQTLDSLQAYVLIAQDRPQVEVYIRQLEGKWEYTRLVGLEARLHLSVIGCELTLADIYARVEFPPPPTEEPIA